MRRILAVILGLVLLAPTAVIFFIYLHTYSNGGPVAFGLWMFFGMPTMLGAFFAFRAASRAA